MKSIVFGTAFEVPAGDRSSFVRKYRIDGDSRLFIGEDTSDISHVCNEACAETVLREAGNYVRCEDPGSYIIVPDAPFNPSDLFTHISTADIQEFDRGDDPYVCCAACGEELHRDDAAYLEMFGRPIEFTGGRTSTHEPASTAPEAGTKNSRVRKGASSTHEEGRVRANLLSTVKGISVNPTRYGRDKAKRHAQSEANRLDHAVILQLDASLSWGSYALLSVNRLTLPSHPFFTYYPERGEQ